MNPHTALNDVSATPRASTNQPHAPEPAPRRRRTITLQTSTSGTRDTIRHTATHTISNDMMDGIHALIDCDRVWEIRTDTDVDEHDVMHAEITTQRDTIKELNQVIDALNGSIRLKAVALKNAPCTNEALRADVADRNRHLDANKRLIAEYRERARDDARTIALLRIAGGDMLDTIKEHTRRETWIKAVIDG